MDLPFDRVWLPYLYLYGVGGLFFLSGMVMVAKAGGFRTGNRTDRRWFGVLVFGFLWYAGMHGAGILAATQLSS